MKSERNKTIDLSVAEGQAYLERCIRVNAPAARAEVLDKTILGDAAAVEVTQGMRIRATTIGKGWRVSEGEHEYDVLHVDDTTPGEMILTTTEVHS